MFALNIVLTLIKVFGLELIKTLNEEKKQCKYVYAKLDFVECHVFGNKAIIFPS